jgi:hypothetical protein
LPLLLPRLLLLLFALFFCSGQFSFMATGMNIMGSFAGSCNC